MSNREIYNASGCLDLTAYLAIRNIEREMDMKSKSAMKNRGRRKRKIRTEAQTEAETEIPRFTDKKQAI